METMISTKTPNFKELETKFSEDKILEIENLLKIVKRYNSELMESSHNHSEIARNENGERDLETIKGIYKRFADETQDKTFELVAILDVITEKLQPLFDVSGEFYEIEHYIKQELTEKK